MKDKRIMLAIMSREQQTLLSIQLDLCFDHKQCDRNKLECKESSNVFQGLCLSIRERNGAVTLCQNKARHIIILSVFPSAFQLSLSENHFPVSRHLMLPLCLPYRCCLIYSMLVKQTCHYLQISRSGNIDVTL